MAIKGIMSGGGHIIISGIEHNSVARPVYAMALKRKITFDVAAVSDNDEETAGNFRKLIRPDTKAIVCTAAGNVTGQILPLKRIADICRDRNICFITDGAQGCGILDVKMSHGINILCTSGHKGLYGPTGTGLLITDGKYHISPIIEGGTGSSSLSLQQPEVLPDQLESGTLNTFGIIALKSGMDFVSQKGIKRIYSHEDRLCRRLINQLDPDYVKIYRSPGAYYAPIVSFNIKGIAPETVAAQLSLKGYCLRAGFHCAPLAHKALGTKNGTVRFAPSVFNNMTQTDSLAEEIKKLYKNS
jgi:selenocysteine lyase/cysteine desulfurase